MTAWAAVRPQHILKKVAEFYGLTITVLLSPSRYREVVRARDAFMWFARGKKGMSWTRIGRFLGKHHTTCMASHRRAIKLLRTDPEFSQEIIFIEALLDTTAAPPHSAVTFH